MSHRLSTCPSRQRRNIAVCNTFLRDLPVWLFGLETGLWVDRMAYIAMCKRYGNDATKNPPMLERASELL